MLAKIICENPNKLRSIIIENINVIEGIDKTETSISLSELISRSSVLN